MRGTKEFEDLRVQFEKDMKNAPVRSLRFDRVSKDANAPPHYFYESGETNDLFHAYMRGYQYMKCLHNSITA